MLSTPQGTGLSKHCTGLCVSRCKQEKMLSPFQGDKIRRSSAIAFDKGHALDLLHGGYDSFTQAHLQLRLIRCLCYRQVEG